MRNFLFIILLSFSGVAQSQHFPIYSQYMMNGLAINPAYAGSRDVLSAALMYRKQWAGFDGAPENMALSAHWPFKNKSLAAGILVMKEKIGITNNVSCFGNYAFRIRMNNGFLSFGLKAGFEMFKENSSLVSTQQPDYVFSNGNSSYFMPNFGFGAYYYNSAFFIGAAVPSFLSYREKSKGDGFEAYNDTKNYNYLLSTGILLNINEHIKIKPSTLIRYHPNAPVSYDANCNVILLPNGQLWLGASYRSKDALVGLVEFQLTRQIRLGYSYDYSFGKISNYNNGTHEIMLRYEFRYILKAINPKYF